MNGSGINGGVMLINPSEELFNEYVSAIPLIAKQQCKYPNEALFEFINNTFYNLPVIYNLSHYHTLRLSKYGVNPNGEDILIYHFNETDFKHIDIIKDGWLKANKNNPKLMEKYRVKKIPINFFEETIYNPNKEKVNAILSSLSSEEEGLLEQMSKLAIKEEEPIKQVEESDWVEGFSNKYQQKYWSNKKTGQSVWEKPKELSGGKKRRTKKRNSKKRVTKKRTTNKRRS
jgi:hypothetical protein